MYSGNFIVDFLLQGPLQAAIFCALTPASLICLSMTCKLANAIVECWMALAFNIDKLLLRYFDKEDIASFRHVQACFGVIISGSSALQFMDRTSYPGSDLDLYLEARHVNPLCRWLISRGYNYVPTRGQARYNQQVDRMLRSTHPRAPFFAPRGEYNITGMVGVFNMKKQGRVIQVIAARNTPLEVILSFHSTCVMNFITYSAAYSLFPRSTFEDRKSLVVETSDGHAISRQKYRDRGWRMVYGRSEDLSSPNHMPSAFGGMERHVGDRYTWTIPLDVSQFELPWFTSCAGKAIPIVKANSWRLMPLSRIKIEDFMDVADRLDAELLANQHIRDPILEDADMDPLAEDPYAQLPDGDDTPIVTSVSTVFRSDVLQFTYLVSDAISLCLLEELHEKLLRGGGDCDIIFQRDLLEAYRDLTIASHQGNKEITNEDNIGNFASVKTAVWSRYYLHWD